MFSKTPLIENPSPMEFHITTPPLPWRSPPPSPEFNRYPAESGQYFPELIQFLISDTAESRVENWGLEKRGANGEVSWDEIERLEQELSNLENSFSRFNLSSSSSSRLGGGSACGLSHLTSPVQTDTELRRLRVQAAVRGQLGPYPNHHQSDHYTNNTTSFALGGHHHIPISPVFDLDHDHLNYNHGFFPNSYDFLSNGSNAEHRLLTTPKQYYFNGRRGGSPSFLPRGDGDDNLRFQNQRRSHHDLPGPSNTGNFSGLNSNPDFHRGRERFPNFNNYSSGSRNPSNYNSSRPNFQNRAGQPPPPSLSLPRQSYTCLEGVKGRIADVAKEQRGCGFLQEKIDEGNLEEIEMIFLEVRRHLDELAVDPYGNYVVQNLFGVCNEEQISEALVSIVEKEGVFLNTCLDVHGTRVMQKLLEHVTTQQQKSLLLRVLRPLTVTLTKSNNGYHVIQHCLKIFSIEENQVLLNEVADNFLDVATDKSGCCLLQQCFTHAWGEVKSSLLASVVTNALLLSEHPFGNYVVQFILEMREPDVTDSILAQLRGNFVTLSMDKYASNVVEMCLRGSGQKQAEQIILEIINSPKFLMSILDRFGNFVAQTALQIAKGHVLKSMVALIDCNYSFLRSHPYGKKVLEYRKGAGKRNLSV